MISRSHENRDSSRIVYSGIWDIGVGGGIIGASLLRISVRSDRFRPFPTAGQLWHMVTQPCLQLIIMDPVLICVQLILHHGGQVSLYRRLPRMINFRSARLGPYNSCDLNAQYSTTKDSTLVVTPYLNLVAIECENKLLLEELVAFPGFHVYTHPGVVSRKYSRFTNLTKFR